MKKFLGLFISLSASFYVYAADATSEVTIPLTEYLNLIEKEKSQPVTVIEEVSLKGDYPSSKFQITFKGQAVSPWKKEAVLASFEGHLRSCTGNGLISFEGGNYHVLPQRNSFQITCALQPKNKNLNLVVLNALFFESQVSNAESNINEDNTARRMISLLEKSKESEQRPRADVIAKARYKLSILPDTSKFEYQFTINNPNRLSEKYSINLANNEVIETVSTTLKYQEAGSGMNFTVPTGEHYVFVKGKIAGQSFKPLLKSEEQYLLIQNHPLMQVQPTTNWRRIATQESSIQQEYNSARAFLIDPKESLSWSAKKLDVYSALGYTLKNAHYLYYVPRNAKAIVEATYQVSNQGTPEIGLQIPGKALYMSVDGQAFPLYKDDKGNLLVSVTSGEHTVVVQYQPEMPERTLANFTQDTLAKPSAVITQSNLTLRHDPAWRMIAGRFGEDFNLNINFQDFVWAFIYGFLFLMLMKKLYKIENKQVLYALSVPVGMLTFLGSFYTFMLFLTLSALTLWRYRNWIWTQIQKSKSITLSYKKIAVALAVFFVATYFLSVVTRGASQMFQSVDHSRAQRYDEAGQAGANYYADKKQAMEAPSVASAESEMAEEGSLASNILSKGKALFGGAQSKNDSVRTEGGENYEGLPARIEIPSNGRNEYFNLSLIDADKEIKMRSFFVKSYFFMLFDFLIMAALAFAIYRNRKILREALSKQYA